VDLRSTVNRDKVKVPVAVSVRTQRLSATVRFCGKPDVSNVLLVDVSFGRLLRILAVRDRYVDVVNQQAFGFSSVTLERQQEVRPEAHLRIRVRFFLVYSVSIVWRDLKS
jgi:hypothetical protein